MQNNNSQTTALPADTTDDVLHSTFVKISVFLLRISMGWYMFYAGITKVLDPSWSAAGYLTRAENFTTIYNWFASPGILPIINFLNEWGLTLIGISLIIGAGVRTSAILGALLMALYYLPLSFPYPNQYAFIIDDHIIFIAAFLVIAAVQAGRVWGLEGRYRRLRW
jgi:thiosulfate dehydrogenase [quinone] large subunit